MSDSVMTDERTNAEQDLDLAMELELLAVGVSGKAYNDLTQAARRLRAMDGERIEGWAMPGTLDFAIRKPPKRPIGRQQWVPATLILHTPQEPRE